MVSTHEVRHLESRVLAIRRPRSGSALNLRPSKNECSQFDGPLIGSAHFVKASYGDKSYNEAL